MNSDFGAVRIRYTIQKNGTRPLSHDRRYDLYFSAAFAAPMAFLSPPLNRIIEVLKVRTDDQALKATARIFQGC